MGIDIHTLNFLRFAKKKKAFGDTVTIGRQYLYTPEYVVKKLVRTDFSYKNSEYCEDLLLGYFGATKVDSIDNSDYEKATHIHNMNVQIPTEFCQKYDTVIDGGCLEHIYNIPQAFKNCSDLLKPGGQVIHILPANNYSGHGFWQFSPELFFSLYSEANGYQETEVFIADLNKIDQWYKIKKPSNGDRVNISSAAPLYVLVRAVLKDAFSHIHVQQSDYEYVWDGNSSSSLPSKSAFAKFKQLLKMAVVINPHVYELLHKTYYRFKGYQLSKRRSDMRLVSIESLT